MKQVEKEFNLLDEPWIRVLQPGFKVKEVSLTDALLNAQDYIALAGEMPTQDVAVLRLLLAVLHAVYYRVDEAGTDIPIRTARDAYRRWQCLWRVGHFEELPIRNYLETYRDRFWLFHPERPFWQSPAAAVGTAYSAAKLNGEISESNNKNRLTPARTGRAKQTLTYAEAARWLLNLNAFDDTSAKPKGKGLPSCGAGWLGKLGLVFARGNSLFETLMLNLVLLQADNSLWDGPTPIWELPEGRNTEREKIALPSDQAALLTLQSRRLLLVREQNTVTGCTLLGGDFFDKEGAFSEQMTVWKAVQEKGETVGHQPRRHSSARQMWRDFNSFVSRSSDLPSPGVIVWHTKLRMGNYLGRDRLLCYQIASVQYGDKDFFITDVFSDSLTFHAGFLSDTGRIWHDLVVDEIRYCDKLAWCVGGLALELCIAAGGEGKSEAEQAQEQFYYRVDIPFRQWLLELDPEREDAAPEDLIEEARESWQKAARQLALVLGKEMVQNAGSHAFVGRTITEKEGKKSEEHRFSAPEAYNHFLARVNAVNEQR